MSTGQLLLTALITLVVFGPTKLPMLARHIAQFMNRLNYFKHQALIFWQKQLEQQQLEENSRKANEADEYYQRDREA